MFKNKSMYFIFLLFGFLLNPLIVKASADFQVNPVYPTEQKNKDLPYFDLYTKDKTKKVSLELINESNKEERFSVKITTPETNMQGIPFFNKEADNPLVLFPKTITVGAKETKTVEGFVNNDAIKNEVGINGIVVTQEGDVKDGESDNIVIPFVLKGTDIPMLRVSVGKVFTTYEETLGTTMVHVPIQNDVGNYERKVRMEAVIKQNGKDVVRHTNTNITILPNHEDEISFPVNLANGEYQIELSIIGKDFSQSYSNNITINTPKEKNFISGGKSSKKKNTDHVEIGILCFVLLCSMIIVLYLISSNPKDIKAQSQDDEPNKRKEDNKKNNGY